MLVQCPGCQISYKVSDSLITTANPTFRCSRCKHIFVLEIKTAAAFAGDATAAPPLLPRQAEPELSFSFAPAAMADIPEEKIKKNSASLEEPDYPPQEKAEFSKPAFAESVPPIEEAPDTDAAKAEPPPMIEEKPPPPLTQEEDRWSLTPSRPHEESFTIAEERRSERMESPTTPESDLEDDWQVSYPPLEERETTLTLDRPLSVIPYISLFVGLLLLYSLLTLMYQAQPRSIENAIKTIPWLGAAVLKNNHLRMGIVLQSMRPSFQTIQGNREVFVLSGVAVNRNPISVREVRVEGHIFNAAGKEIDQQTISIGNAISSKIIRDLTAQEISILQKLNPQKRFEISPDESAGFVIVFLKPSGEVKNFSCRILSAETGI